MLSPHEFATLLLVKDSPNQVDMEREELDALLERQLVQLESHNSGPCCNVIRGHDLVAACRLTQGDGDP